MMILLTSTSTTMMTTTMKWDNQTTATIRRMVIAGSVPPAHRTTLANLVKTRMAHYGTPPRERVRMGELIWTMATAGWSTPVRMGSTVMAANYAVIYDPSTPPAGLIAVGRFVLRVQKDLTAMAHEINNGPKKSRRPKTRRPHTRFTPRPAATITRS